MTIISPSVPVRDALSILIREVVADGLLLPVPLRCPFTDEQGRCYDVLTLVDGCADPVLVSDWAGCYIGLDAVSPVVLYRVYRDVVLERCAAPGRMDDLIRRMVDLSCVSERAVAAKYLREVFSDSRNAFLRFDAELFQCPYAVAFDHFLGNTTEGVECFDEVACDMLPDGRLLLTPSLRGAKTGFRLCLSDTGIDTYDPYWDLPPESAVALAEAVHHAVGKLGRIEKEVTDAIGGYGVTLEDDDRVLRENGIERLTDLSDYPEGEEVTDASSDQYFIARKEGVRFTVLVHYGQWSPYGFTYQGWAGK